MRSFGSNLPAAMRLPVRRNAFTMLGLNRYVLPIVNAWARPSILGSSSGRTQQVVIEIIWSRIDNVFSKIPAEDRLFVALLIIHSPDEHIAVFIGRIAVDDLAARIVRTRQFLRIPRAGLLNSDGSIRLLTNGARSVDCAAAVARRRGEGCEVAGIHRGRGNKGDQVGWILADLVP